jgi:twitching motility protein PilI
LGHEIEPSAPGTAPARLVLFGPRVGELRAGLVVERVLGLRNLVELVRGDSASDAPAWYGARWTDREGGVWQEIDLALLAQDPAFLQVGV